MQKDTATKILAVALAACCVTLAVVDRALGLGLTRYGLCTGASGSRAVVLHHLVYPLLHGGILHAAVNGWVLLQIAWRTTLRPWHLAVAYGIACCCPDAVAGCLSGNAGSVVGMSGVVYALFGMWMPCVARRVRYNVIVVAWTVVGAVAGSVSAPLHVFCYVLGVAFGSLRSELELYI